MLKITHNKVKMTAKRKHMIAAAEFYAKKLGIHKMNATILIVFKYDYCKTFQCLAMCEYTKTGFVTIEIDANLHSHIYLGILAHEMVHAKQYLKGELSEKKDFQLWKGKKIAAELPYVKQPWELEAMRKQAVLNYQYLEFIK